MSKQLLSITAIDNHVIGVHHWPAQDAVGTLVWLHGMAEHGGRYGALGETLSEHGWNLYCPDHRGHGTSIDDNAPRGHFADEDGWDKVIGDILQVLEHVKPDRGPLVLGGHSMGSFLALAAAEQAAEQLGGLVLCGSDSHSPWFYRAMTLLMGWQRRRHGARGHSPLVHKMTFQTWAASIADARTEFDWLSTDQDQVDAYIADPACGFECTTSTWLALISALAQIQSGEQLARLPSLLPILLLGGRQDPMSNKGKGMDRLEHILKRRHQHLERLDCPSGRHEILNDYCAPEVRQTLLQWLANL